MPHDLDDDDYFPRDSGRKSARGFPILLVVGIGVGVIVGAVALFAMRSSRQAAERDAEAFARTAAVKTTSDPVSGNWPKAIGKWVHQPKDADDVAAPVGFEFHQNMTGQITWIRRDGSQDTQSFQVDVTANQGDLLEVRFHDEKPAYTFRFTVDPNGTLVLRGSMIVYSRP